MIHEIVIQHVAPEKRDEYIQVFGDILKKANYAGAHGIKFVNFRRDASMQEYGKVKEPELESALARGGRLVGDLR